jgi:peroxiredoxin
LIIISSAVAIFILIVLARFYRVLIEGNNIKKFFLDRIKDSQLNNGDYVYNFKLRNIKNEFVSLESFLDKNVVLLVVDTGCDVCNLDIKEFAEESCIYGDTFHFIPVIYSSSGFNKDKLQINEHKFKDILFADHTFLKKYKITLFPTFILINTEQRFVSYVRFANELKNFFNPFLEKQLVKS